MRILDPLGGLKLIFFQPTVHLACIITFIFVTQFKTTDKQYEEQEKAGFLTLSFQI